MAFARVFNPAIRVSIVIPYFAKASTLLRCLDRLRHQSLLMCAPGEVEIIVVDDGTEGEDIRSTLPEEVTYLWQRKRRYGIARAKNTGARIANGKYLIFLDPDLLVSENYIDAVLRGFDRFGDRILQTGYLHDYHFKGCPDPRTEFGVWNIADGLSGRFYQLAGGNSAISRDLFLETGGFDEDLIDGGVEDLLFGYLVGQLPRTAMYFSREMAAWHIPHPPSPAHADPQATWTVVKGKYPEFYDAYFVRGLR
jgi:GT2 family glycosyltransferase